VGIPPRDFQGAVGTEGNLPLVFRGFHGPAFSTALRVCREAAHHMRPVADGEVPVQMLVDGHRRAGQRIAKAALFQLPALFAHSHGVVLGHHALGLNREDPVQIGTRRPAKRRSLTPRRRGEFAVELGDVAVTQNALAPPPL